MRGAAILLLAMLGACAAPQPPVTPLPERPTVVSLNPCTDAILAEVADRDQVLAISHYSHDPRAASMPLALARQYRATRGSVEEVLALQPDLVLGTSFTDPASASAYARLGLRLERLGIARNVAESRAQVRRIAALVGHPDRGEALIARIDRALAAAARPPGSARPEAVIWQSGGIVPGDQALIVELLEHAGFANSAQRRGLAQADYLALEAMLADPPPVLLVVGGGSETGEGSDRLRFHPALAALEGTMREPLDARFLYCGGPTIIGVVEHLAQIRQRL